MTSIEARVLRKGGRIVGGEVELRGTADGTLNAMLCVTGAVVRAKTR